MPRALAAAALYFAIVFAVGFILGPVRVLLLEPMVGNTFAVVIEAPFLLAAIVWAARHVSCRMKVSPLLPDLLVMGCSAAVLVLLADLAIGLPLRGITMADQLNYLSAPAGLPPCNAADPSPTPRPGTRPEIVPLCSAIGRKAVPAAVSGTRQVGQLYVRNLCGA
jgi:hypothetical protein